MLSNIILCGCETKQRNYILCRRIGIQCFVKQFKYHLDTQYMIYTQIIRTCIILYMYARRRKFRGGYWIDELRCERVNINIFVYCQRKVSFVISYYP